MRALLILTMFSLSSLLAIIPDMEFSVKALKDNKYFLRVINQGISNFGTDDHKARLRAAVTHHYNAHIYHVGNDFKQVYREIRSSHRILRDLYYDVLQDVYIRDCRAILDKVAPKIINSRDPRSQNLMKLAYRDLQLTTRYMRIGRHYNKFLYSVKIRNYLDAVKIARRAKRYAFLAVIESNTPLEDRDNFKKQTLDDHLSKAPKEVISDYKRVRNKLKNRIERGLVVDHYNYFIHHFDNYGYIAKSNVMENHMTELTGSSVERNEDNTIRR